jgi:PAS domain S-box-containing protein
MDTLASLVGPDSLLWVGLVALMAGGAWAWHRRRARTDLTAVQVAPGPGSAAGQTDIEQSLAMILSSIGSGLIVTDVDGRVIRINVFAEQILGWAHDEALQRPFWEVFVREGRPPEMLARNPLDVMVERGISVDDTQQVVAVARDGRRTEVEVKATLTHDPAGQVRGMVVVFRDMTRLNEAEAERHRLAAIVESSGDAIISKTLDGRIVSWNRAAERMFGYTADEVLGQPVQLLIPPGRQAEEMRILANLAHGQSVQPFDTVRMAKDGTLLDVSISISPVRDASGRVVGGSKIARDVTQQRRAAAALRESEARLRLALDSAQIGEWDMDLSSGLTTRSSRHDRCFGHETLLDEWTIDTLIEHVVPAERAEVLRSFGAAVRASGEWHVECQVQWPDGGEHWLAIHAGVLREDGREPRMLGIVTDITAQKVAESSRLRAQRLEAENRQIQEANRLKSQFLANMSHELRTPLNAIIGFADLLNTGAVPHESPKQREFLGHIAASGRHLLQLINDVLDLSKVESGKFEFFPEPVALSELVREVCDTLQPAAQRKCLSIQTDVSGELDGRGELMLDAARFKQVLFNYLSNAVKFTPDGGAVTVRARADGPEHFVCEVEDSGIGIEPADLPRLFIDFQQLDSGYNRQHQGTGLGLALTRRLVEAQGGTVGVRSVRGVGSVFYARLPRDTRRAQDGPSPSTRRWLVIENHRQTQDRVKQALSSAGHQVDVVSTGQEAMHQARQQTYDAIALDLVLPDHHGLGTLESIRRDGPNRASPVLAVSMPGASGDERQAAFAIADVLSKPIRTDEVVSAMARLAWPSAEHRRVLVIDDDAQALEIMRATLELHGIETVCMQDGRRALLQLDQLRPDAIVLDLMMPEFDGFAVLDALNRVPAWRHTPVLIWTSMILTDDEYAALSRSAQAILSKGGGELESVLEALSRWRPAPVTPPGEERP